MRASLQDGGREGSVLLMGGRLMSSVGVRSTHLDIVGGYVRVENDFTEATWLPASMP